MKRFCEAFLKLEKGIGGALLLLMLVVVFFATVGRYTGLYNMSWSDEAARYLMIWFVFLLAGLSAFRGEMFSIDLVTEHLSVTGQKVASNKATAKRLLREYDAVLLCCGAGEPRPLGLDTKGPNAGGTNRPTKLK